jgi:hypothetical protein
MSFASLSLSASVDQQTGQLSVFDVVDEIRTPQVPIHIQTLVLSIILDKSNIEAYSGKLFIHLITPDGKSNQIGNGDLKIPPEQKKLKAVFRLGGFPILQFGRHRFVLSWANDQMKKEGEALIDFDVIQVNQQTQPQVPGGNPGMLN